MVSGKVHHMTDVLSLASRFIPGAAVFEPLGNGHINSTWLVRDGKGNSYTLQKINHTIFTDVPSLMRNIELVTEYLNARKPGSSLELVKTDEGRSWLQTPDGFFRVYRFVEGITLEKASAPEEMQTCGEAFGGFQMDLSEFDADKLTETIPRFHDSVKRFHDLERAASEDVCGRFKNVREEYDFYVSRGNETGVMLEMLAEGRLKKRVTHNDTKINNVLLDGVTLAPKCILDLDTVMPGLAGNDFGDCIRTGASTAEEDETDLSKVRLDLDLYRAFARGFLRTCGKELNRDEITTLPMGARLMTYETGARFLTDYLKGDVYYRIAYPEHNLVRTHTQIRLISEMENHSNEINTIIEQEANA